MRRSLSIVLILAGCQQQPRVPAKIKFADVAVTLPASEPAFPIRAGSEAMTANCAACHSPEMILDQPALTTEQWKAEIKKMKDVYKAPIDPAAEPAILAYLEATSAAIAPPVKGDAK